MTTRLSNVLVIYGLNQEYKNEKSEIETDLRKTLRMDSEDPHKNYKDVEINYKES